ncbi:alpha/beta hydrolase family protein [Steroidobacter sp.]|uniref:alpha/beta hydrolase family protein n=1 Tax=Steroidobacter sp. TaxID=1978227 RepID=UPI001A3B4786|nr:alpha/beta fold hydrolase [Steroidobacter sp.]MBL8271477.1 S9 family peptidase [Steroidobacter sp.]
MRKLFGCLLAGACLLATTGHTLADGASKYPAPKVPEYRHDFDILERKIEVLTMYQRLGDIAQIEEIRITSLPPRTSNPTALGAGNPLVFSAYTFVPKALGNRKAPLLVFPHGGVHSNFSGLLVTIARELLQEGYVVIAPEYRGSKGFGRGLYDEIDYGGAEIDDTHATRDWAVENLPNVDASRVGILGWSHGGFHALMNIFRWPGDYQVAYAGVPVSDLVQRMAYQPSYPAIFNHFIGKSVEEDPMEYRRRSPVYHADKLQTPLLIHSTTNDGDVHVMEVEHLIAALKAANKKFEYRIYDNAPGGHGFNMIDTKLAKESRRDVYKFLARYLKPVRLQ